MQVRNQRNAISEWKKVQVFNSMFRAPSGVWLRSAHGRKFIEPSADFLRALIHQFLFCCLRDWRHGLVAMIFMIHSNYPFMLNLIFNLIAHFERQSPRNRKQSLNAYFHDTHAAFLFSRKASSTLRSTSGIHSNLGYPRSTSLITEIECWLNGSSEQARQKRFVEQLCRVSCSLARSP